MSILTPLTKLAVVGGIATLAYTGITGGISLDKTPKPVEAGYENPAYVKLQAPVNEKGNQELFLTYENGETKLSLPVLSGPNGPLVGDANYYWGSISAETKSSLVEESWNELGIDTRKSILTGELEKMIENYGKVMQNE